MYPQQIHKYVQQFFTENDCPILTDNPHYLIVQLTEAMDKKIMNRPFYWQYIESTGGKATPAQLTLITNYNELDQQVMGETIHFGSPRLTQLFHATSKMGAFVRLYEQAGDQKDVILTPWLVVNYKVSYCSHRTKEAIHSLGMNLMTGDVFKEFQAPLFDKQFQETVPENTFQLPYTIQPARAIERLDAVLEAYVLQDDHTWVEEAKEKWEKEKMVLDYFYEGVEIKPERYEREQDALKKQYEAKIEIDVMSGGLFYIK